MLRKLKGIVLHSIKHQENNLIVYLYTNGFGRQTYIAKGVRNAKSKNKANIFQPLFLLDIEVSYHERAGMQSIRECKLAEPLHDIPYNARKSAIALFMGELLYKTIREEEVNAELFEFLYHSIRMLDTLDDGIANFHLHFMVQLSRYLGFLPLSRNTGDEYFDIKSGAFTLLKPLHPQYFEPPLAQLLGELQQVSASNICQIKISSNSRYLFLDKMIDFYSYHFDRILPVNALSILHEVFAEHN